MVYESLFYFYITGVMIITFIAPLFVLNMRKGGYFQDDELCKFSPLNKKAQRSLSFFVMII